MKWKDPVQNRKTRPASLMSIFHYLLLSVFLSAGIGLPALEAEELVLVAKGKATVPISTSPDSGEEETNLAKELAT
ncbi:MAG: hypothetical protein P1U87_06840 [Verrucomicrobiales bacterium]|nr:hypothetical protein [Verrucomicrobiales bacterium]